MCQDCRRALGWLPHGKMSWHTSCSHLWNLPKRTLWTWQFSAQSALGLLQSSQEGEEKRGGGIPVTEVRRLCFVSQPSPCCRSLSLSSVRRDKQPGGGSEEASRSPTATCSQCRLNQPLSFYSAQSHFLFMQQLPSNNRSRDLFAEE